MPLSTAIKLSTASSCPSLPSDPLSSSLPLFPPLASGMDVDMVIDSAPNGDAASGAASAVVPPAPTAPAAPAAPAPPPSTARFAQVSESLRLEHQFARVPLEHLKKTIRTNYRLAEKEVAAVISSVAEAADRHDAVSRDDALTQLSSLVSRLQGLKRKLEEGSRAENLQTQRCRARLEHLDSAANTDKLAEWKDVRLRRILVDYMLRMSYYDTAKNLAETSKIQELVDIDVFLEAKRVIDSLQNKEVAPALAWCAENKSRLKRSKSKLEFQLRLQEFIELVRADENLRAISYARKYLAPWGATYMKELQRVVATLAFRHDTECSIYKVLFEPTQWDYLVEQFKQEFCRLFGMTNEPLLNVYLQAGLTALKTPKEDPLSQEGFRKLAEPLPFSKLHHSKLVCYITKELMDHENPPLVLPNGYVYSTKAYHAYAGGDSSETHQILVPDILAQIAKNPRRIYPKHRIGQRFDQPFHGIHLLQNPVAVLALQCQHSESLPCFDLHRVLLLRQSFPEEDPQQLLNHPSRTADPLPRLLPHRKARQGLDSQLLEHQGLDISCRSAFPLRPVLLASIFTTCSDLFTALTCDSVALSLLPSLSLPL
ncbi:macrophage erythroblast [Musa troglodytarum]|uniref:Macrophage erythroblast n=1 Tax=Musa troglodytarum TaxID=320322 RepID=A0A9E7HRZ3_9LILI|nr:macrophage erythroblast [Musa troglodytarum]